MTSPAVQAVERELSEAESKRCLTIRNGWNSGRSLLSMLDEAMREGIAIGRAESRTAEQGAVGYVIEQVLRNIDDEGIVIWPKPQGMATTPVYLAPPTVAAATRAAFEKIEGMIRKTAVAIAQSDTPCARVTSATLGGLASDVMALAEALPAEAPEGREADRMADPNYYPPSSGDHPFARWFTDYQQRAGLDAAQATSAYYTGVSAWRAALGVIAASPEAAQPAATQPKEQYMEATQVGRVMLTRHPLLRAVYNLAGLIEACGASTELTAASVAAFALLERVTELLDELDDARAQPAASERDAPPPDWTEFTEACAGLGITPSWPLRQLWDAALAQATPK